jgi:hypothetical protein
MTTLLNLILLPVRAPMVLLLLLVSTYLGLHWSRPGSMADVGMSGVTDLIWSVECLQALVVVVVCTLPDLLLRRLSTVMASSRVASLVVTLLLVITGGLYLLHLDVLSNVLILACTVLLARLDLVRLRVVTPPFTMTVVLSMLVLAGITLGRSIETHLRPYLPPVGEHAAPAARRAESPQSGAERPAAARSAAAESSRPPAAAAEPHREASAAAASRDDDTPEPDRVMPHVQESRSASEAP